MKLMEELRDLLKEDSRFTDSNGNLLKNRIVECALKLDEHLIKLLLKNERIKKHFFKTVDDILVFDKEKFMKFVDNKEFLPNSYTVFKNKIGLANEEGKYLAKSKEVVLVWPYKDCIFEGGQERSDEKRREIFHNVILAPDEIDRLLEPKVFTNFKRIDKDGEHPLDGFRRDPEINKKRGLPEDTITDNLIIKGNNLLVLHSLLKEFRGKVKLIYIDPPYNTGSDEFQYNDSFKHSTWLTFMKNRLEVAKELLREDGVIFVQIDDNELAHLKVLMDEIFGKSPSGRSNFVQYVEIKANVGAANEYQNPFMPKNCEYGLIYAKNYDKRKYKPIWVKSKVDRAYNKIILNPEEKDFRKWRIGKVMDEFIKQYGEENKDNEELLYKFVFENIDRIFQTIYPKGPGEGLKKAMEESRENTWAVYRRKGKEDILCYKGRMVRFYSKNLKRDINGNIIIGTELGSLWTDIAWQGIAPEGGVKLKHGKKPEKLLRRIIYMFTEPGDIVLDFFMGSGTTCAVAHKMGRQYIGVEQLDYGKNSAVVRLKNVINGDKTGISKEVNWQGGGDFVYMELMKLNEAFVEKIRDAETTDELLNIWEEMKYNGFLSYRVDPKLFDENMEEFKVLNLEEQKKLLLETLDYNDLYVNYSEIDDAIYGVSEEDKKLNKDFYKGRK